jgi:hypothetical protein
MKIPIGLSFCFLIAACSSTDVSERSPVSSVSRQTVPLVRKAYLKPSNQSLILGHGILFFRDKPSFELTDQKPEGPHRLLAPGTKVYISSIQDEVYGDSRHCVAYGSTALPDGTMADFGYRWGFFTSLYRAPWERSSLPKRREWNP